MPTNRKKSSTPKNHSARQHSLHDISLHCLIGLFTVGLFTVLPTMTSANEPAPFTPPLFQHGIHGAQPHYGEPNSPSHGHPHYEHPNHRYGHWYRPRATNHGTAERCAPSPFCPRGYGNLFNEPSGSHRADYNRYTLARPRSQYGPSYYHRIPVPHCCNKTNKCECGSHPRKTKVWSLR